MKLKYFQSYNVTKFSQVQFYLNNLFFSVTALFLLSKINFKQHFIIFIINSRQQKNKYLIFQTRIPQKQTL